MRHAYMIMAHNQLELLKLLISCLDHPQNDFFIHIDKKTNNVDFNDIQKAAQYSKIIFTERVSVSWGAFSQVKAELTLLKAAVVGKYDYYHLLSGADLPVKSNEEILEFFEQYKGFEFVHFSNSEYCNSYNTIRRVKYYYPLQEFGGKELGVYGVFTRVFIKLQQLFGINRIRKYGLTISCGSQWFSITSELAEFVLDNELLVRKLCKFGFCVDEIFIQTLVYNSKFIDRVYERNDNEDYISSLRYIDWKRGNPYTFRICDYEELVNSKFLFARKFNIEKDTNICMAIVNTVKSAN